MTDYINTLPSGFTYRLSEFTGDYSGVESNYKAIFHASLRTMDDVSDWITTFSRQTQTNWNVRDTHKELQILQRKDYVCHMKDYHSRPKKFAKSSIRYKHCDCPATITFKIKQVNRESCKRYDWVRDGMPTTVFIDNNHNHGVLNAEALSFRKIDPITRSVFNSYFDQGMSPTAAADYHIHQLDLDPEATNGPVSRADAALNPTRSTVSYLYTLWRQENLGDRQGDGMWDVLEKKLSCYTDGGHRISVIREPPTVAILTPIMQRAHHLKTANEVAFVDSTASCDSNSHSITFLLVTSPYGAVPAGVMISAGQSQSDYTTAFSALNQLLPDQSFGGQGHPKVFITDDSLAEKGALQTVWPNALQKLCHFHVMQAVWRWLWEAKNSISKEDRKPLMQGFRKILYSVTEEMAEEALKELQHLATEYPNFVLYFMKLWQRRELWCMAWRNIPALRGHHTNNYAEVTVRLFKDHILNRCKAYNLVALVDFVVSVMERFYRNRLERFANSRITMHHLLLEKLLDGCKDIPLHKIQVIESPAGSTYLVQSASDASTSYEVDPGVGVCTCPRGMDGRCCKHQAAIYKFFKESIPNIPPVTAASRYEAASLALGDKVLPPQFYQSVLIPTDSSEACNPHAAQSSSSEQLNLSASQTADLLVHESDISERQYRADASHQALIMWKDLSAEMESAIHKHSNNCGDDDLIAGMNKFKQRLSNVNTGSQLCTFFHSFGQMVPRRYHAGSMIPTQPTAAARRKRPGITRGAKRQLVGRPALAERVSAKRPRNLAHNIEAGVPNAKSHGQGH